MGICGYFFYKSVHKYSSLQQYISKKLPTRLLGLIVPMITFGFFKILLDIAMGKTITSGIDIFKMWISAAKGIWFLGDLAVNTVVVLLVIQFCSGKIQHDLKYFLAGMLLTMIPLITYQRPHMYLYFVIGYWIAAYLPKNPKQFLFIWKYILFAFIVAYLAFSNMPWPPEEVWFDYHNQSIMRLLINNSLKIFLGITGSYLALAFVYYMMPHIKDSWLLRRATVEGRFTLDIYLIQIILIEKLAGPMHRAWVKAGGVDLFNFNMPERIIVTFITSLLFMELLVRLSKLFNRNRLIAKMLFYRNV